MDFGAPYRKKIAKSGIYKPFKLLVYRTFIINQLMKVFVEAVFDKNGALLKIHSKNTLKTFPCVTVFLP
jgi:hypothetical protein